MYVYVCVRKIASAVWVIDSRGKIGWTDGPVVYLTQTLSQGLGSKGRGNTLGDTQDELAGFWYLIKHEERESKLTQVSDAVTG